MSKIGRRSIELGNVKVEVKGQEVYYTGSNDSGVHELPELLRAELLDNKLKIVTVNEQVDQEINRIWGLHRALLANKIKGADKGFEKNLVITGLGFKGGLSGDKIIFSLGYSHKIDFPLPEGINVEIDKSGQNIKVKGFDKQQVGLVCSKIKALRPIEPYKGTGIKFADETIIRKEGKTKGS